MATVLNSCYFSECQVQMSFTWGQEEEGKGLQKWYPCDFTCVCSVYFKFLNDLFDVSSALTKNNSIILRIQLYPYHSLSLHVYYGTNTYISFF